MKLYKNGELRATFLFANLGLSYFLWILNYLRTDKLLIATLFLAYVIRWEDECGLLHEICVPLPLDDQGALLHLAYKATFISLLWFERASCETTWSLRHFTRIQLVITILKHEGVDEVPAINFVKEWEEKFREVTPLNTKIIARDLERSKSPLVQYTS